MQIMLAYGWWANMTEIELQYDYCMQSVRKIAELKLINFLSDDNSIDLEANIDYLTEMLTSDIWTTEDLQPLRDAIK